LIAVALFIVAAKLVNLFLDKVLRRFSRFTRTDVDDRIIDLIQKPLFYTIVLSGIVVASGNLELAPRTVFYTRGTVYSLLTIVWSVTAVRISNTLIEYAVAKSADLTGLSKDIVPLVENVSKIVLIVATLMVILSIWHIDITPVMASAGIAGAAVAFAAKDTIANFFGGISLFVDRPFKIGDFVVLDSGERGEVVNIGSRIKTRDDIQISVPNSVIASTKIINESAPVPNFRVRIPVGVAYGSDIDQVQETLLEIAHANSNVIAEPAPRVRFRQFGESSLNFELLCWAKEPVLRGRTIHELNCVIYKRFNQLGIKFPFPQRDVHIHQG
jgi:small-conductance mechanosensitive channel